MVSYSNFYYLNTMCDCMAFEESTGELLEVARLRYRSTVAEAKASLNRANSCFK